MGNPSGPISFTAEDPRTDDVRALLATHLAFSQEVTPAEDVHALDIDGLLDPAVTVFAARRAGVLVGVGALRQLGDGHAELKSMHTAQTARGLGVGRAMVDHLLGVARARGCTRVSLETGTMEAFAPARALYTVLGFEPCEPFGTYLPGPGSVCMTIEL